MLSFLKMRFDILRFWRECASVIVSEDETTRGETSNLHEMKSKRVKETQIVVIEGMGGGG